MQPHERIGTEPVLGEFWILQAETCRRTVGLSPIKRVTRIEQYVVEQVATYRGKVPVLLVQNRCLNGLVEEADEKQYRCQENGD